MTKPDSRNQATDPRDLVTRLRNGVYGLNRIPLCEEAAVEIERLRENRVHVRECQQVSGGAEASLIALLARELPRWHAEIARLEEIEAMYLGLCK